MLKEAVMATVHCGLMQDNLVLVSGTFKEYAYSANLVNAMSLNQKHYIPLIHTNDYNKFVKFLDSSPIYSVMIYQTNGLLLQKSIMDFSIVAKDWNVIIQPGTLINRLGHYFSVNSRDSSKYKAILRLMEVTKINNFDNVYYYALNTVNKQCINAFKHHLMHQYLALKTDYYDQINIQASTDQIIENMTHAFFEGNDVDISKFENRGIIDTKKLTEIMDKL
ncbi:hypothetical protein FACS1894218_1350 [Bacilli bacterium]|nr:hypothetical protein FACS1894218_1350 [Bacilli bacterium]